MTLRALCVLGVLCGPIGCDGTITDRPPVQLQRNMLNQAKGKTQSASEFFADGRTMRPQEQGVVARNLKLTEDDEHLRADDPYWRGKVKGQPAKTYPPKVQVDAVLLARGRQAYDIHCAACHDRTGAGRGLVLQRPGFAPAPKLYEQRVVNLTAGEMFDAISNGQVGARPITMPGYAHQIPVADRWAIIAYVRALQRARRTKLEDLTPQEREALPK